MDYDAHQARARRNTFLLAVLYAASLLVIILLLYLVLIAFLSRGRLPSQVDPEVLGLAAWIVVVTVGIETFLRFRELKRGGVSVMESLGGRHLKRPSKNIQELQLINIVEELSIATSLPAPSLYLFDLQEDINGFAAAFHASDAAIGITRGAVEKLTREELEGVIAHEFAHIIFGDARRNTILIGALHGIQFLSNAGRNFMEFSGGATKSLSDFRIKSGIFIFGFFLHLVGVIGIILSRIITSAISREREYNADASAVAYTRNPHGLVQVFKKIAVSLQTKNFDSLTKGSVRHLLFAYMPQSYFDRLVATHPPLHKRARRLLPFSDVPAVIERANKMGIFSLLADTDPAKVELLQNASYDPYYARALICIALLHENSDIRREQKSIIRSILGDEVSTFIDTYASGLSSAAPGARLQLIELTSVALRQLSCEQGREFKILCRRLVRIDLLITPTEMALECIIERVLAPRVNLLQRAPSLSDLSQELSYLLTIAFPHDPLPSLFLGKPIHRPAVIDHDSLRRSFDRLLDLSIVDRRRILNHLFTLEANNEALQIIGILLDIPASYRK